MPVQTLSGGVISSLGASGIVQSYSFETLDFQRRVIANGGNVLTATELAAVDFIVKLLKILGLFDSGIAFYPYVGGNAGSGSKESFAVNLISSSFLMTNQNITNAMCSTLYTGNGTNACWKTGIIPSTHLNASNFSMGFGSDISTGIAKYDMGANRDSGSPFKYTYITARWSDNNYYAAMNSGSFSTIPLSGTNSIFINSVSSSTHKAFIDDTITTSTISFVASVPDDIYLGAVNHNGTAELFSNRPYKYYLVLNTALTDAQGTALKNGLRTFSRMLNK